ncbi:MAG: anhydro-N-acetylmuramic acid kinase [Bacteroidetes bacterium]|nr:anhydro-N-acetylmuramic acid kinase [Bacteroidota bacterium]
MSQRTSEPLRWSGPPPRLVAGVLSGTSADGVTACLVEIAERHGRTRIREIATLQRPYPAGLRAFILRHSLPGTGSVDIISRLHMALGVCFADAVRALARRAGVPLSSIDLVGSHGQTVQHMPDAEPLFGLTSRSTLQIGDPSVVAQRTGIVTVGDFRTADMAVGGQGAPLVPYLDAMLFRHSRRKRILLNLGGIANITVLPRAGSREAVRAFDTGPANMVIDALAERLFGEPFDRHGHHARRGMIILPLMDWARRHPYFRRPPPKSTGRELFGAAFVDELLRRGRRHDPHDLIATATEITAWSVVDQVRRYVRGPIDEMLVSGGGAHNRHVMRRLADLAEPVDVRTVDDVGVSVDSKEAILFALLARAAVLGRPANLPTVTGASRSVILGKICIP